MTLLRIAVTPLLWLLELALWALVLWLLARDVWRQRSRNP